MHAALAYASGYGQIRPRAVEVNSDRVKYIRADSKLDLPERSIYDCAGYVLIEAFLIGSNTRNAFVDEVLPDIR